VESMVGFPSASSPGMLIWKLLNVVGSSGEERTKR
jgi:hypothetical protein